MMQKPLIREATRRDIQSIAALVGQYWEFEGIENYESDRIVGLLEKVIDSPGLGKLWVSEIGDGLCGYLLVTFSLSLEYGGLMAQIDEFYVSKPYRSLGIGNKLLQKSEFDLNAMSIVRIELQLGRNNNKAREFYHRHGFLERDGYELLDKPLSTIFSGT
jgi:ribosomal protein S18 acetylase RimI-like enzyme